MGLPKTPIFLTDIFATQYLRDHNTQGLTLCVDVPPNGYRMQQNAVCDFFVPYPLWIQKYFVTLPS